MNSSSAFAIHADTECNVMYFNFVGHVKVAEMTAGLVELKRVVATLRPGFMIFSDLSDLESMDLDCAGPLTKTMDLCRTKGVGTVVRVIPNPIKDIGFNILSVIHYREGVKIRTFHSRAEADAALKL